MNYHQFSRFVTSDFLPFQTKPGNGHDCITVCNCKEVLDGIIKCVDAGTLNSVNDGDSYLQLCVGNDNTNSNKYHTVLH